MDVARILMAYSNDCTYLMLELLHAMKTEKRQMRKNDLYQDVVADV